MTVHICGFYCPPFKQANTSSRALFLESSVSDLIIISCSEEALAVSLNIGWTLVIAGGGAFGLP